MNKGRIVAIIVLLVFLAGGSYWFIRRNRKPPPEEQVTVDKFGKEVDIKTLLGTLSVRPTLEQKADSSPRYWIYIDGRIVATRPNPDSDSNSLNAIDVLLVPGEYNVEVCVTVPNSEDSGSTFPFAFRSKKIRVAAGQVESLPLSVEAKSYDEPTALSPFDTPSWEWFEPWVKRVESEVQSFQKDPIHLALLEVLNALQQSDPVRPAVYVNLPAERGGGREFDAQQLRLMIAWLKRYRSDPLSPLPADFVDRMPGDVRARYDQVEGVITNYQNYINQFDAIPKKLDSAEN